MGVWWGRARQGVFSQYFFSSWVRMIEKAALPERDRKGKRITWGSGTTFTCYLFLFLEKRENGGREGLTQMKSCPEPQAGRARGMVYSRTE